MRLSMILLAAACAAIGLAPILFWPAVARAIVSWNPEWTAASGAAPLSALGNCHLAVAAVAALAAAFLGLRVRRNGVGHAGTWDCGYAAPTPRMQYTAGSFAGIITEWFAWILQPVRHVHPPHGPFPKQASYQEHTPETVLEKVVEPVGAGILRVAVSVRRLQHGRLSSYILYLLMGVLGLAVLVWWGGAQ